MVRELEVIVGMRLMDINGLIELFKSTRKEDRVFYRLVSSGGAVRL